MGSELRRQLPEPGKTLEFVSSSPCFGIFWRCCNTITPNLQCLMSGQVNNLALFHHLYVRRW